MNYFSKYVYGSGADLARARKRGRNEGDFRAVIHRFAGAESPVKGETPISEVCSISRKGRKGSGYTRYREYPGNIQYKQYTAFITFNDSLSC